MIRFTRISLKDFIKKHNPQEPKKETIENFEKEINSLLENAKRQDDEEFQKNEINKFLKNAYGYDCNTSKKVDSAIYVDGEVRVLIEVKALDKKTEFPKDRENPLSKAFCQMVLYFLEEIEKEKNNSLKHTIICNAHEFFLFDCKDLFFLKEDKHIKKYNFFALDDKSLLDGLNYFTPSLFGTLKLSPKEEEEAFASYGRIRALRKKLDDALSGREYQNAFEWRFEFPEVLDDEGDFLGFDCIIGNPPYIRQEQIKDLKPLLQKQYQDFYNSTADIYTYFFALSYHLLKEKGFSAFITSNKYARAKYGAKLREWLLKKTTIVSYMELNALKVFESATVDTSIIHFIKQPPLKESDFKYYEPTPNDKDDLKSTPSLPMRQNALSTESFIFANATLLDLRDKMENIGTPLKDWDIQIYRGILTGANEAFIITTEKRDAILNACKTQEERECTERLIKPILRGKDIKKYSYEWAHLWVINTHNGYTSNLKSKIPPIDIAKYPATKAHLDAHYDTIATRCDQGDTPYHLRNCAYLEDFEKEKIVYSEIVQEPRFYLDNGECELGVFYAEATSFILTGEHLCYLLGMLHSKLITFAFKTFYAGGGLGESGYRYKKAFIERLPIPQITEKNQELADKITDGAKQILALKEKDPKANTQKLEKEIDALVYQLYNLTDEEIKIIEDGQEIKSALP